MRALVLLVALALCSPLRASADDTPAAPPPLEQEGAPEPLPEPPATTAEGVHYTGAHPLGDGGYCYETGAHVHEAAPAEPLAPAYRDCDGQLCYVGDPVPYGYEGSVVGYEGTHPLVVPVVSYCYLPGFHYHVAAPDPVFAAWYAFFNGAWKYRGSVTVAYTRDRARYDRPAPRLGALPAHARLMRLARRFYTAAARQRLAHEGGRLVLRLGARAGAARTQRAATAPRNPAQARPATARTRPAPPSQPPPRR